MSFIATLQLDLPLNIPTLLPLSETYFARTTAETKVDKRIGLAQRTVRSAPERAENWVLLAAAYQANDKALTRRVFDALRKSYKVAPLSPDAHDWRLAYVFSNWSRMPDDLKVSGMAEADAYVTRYAGYIHVKALAPTLPDAEGRLALSLVALTRDRASDSARRLTEYKNTHPIYEAGNKLSRPD